METIIDWMIEFLRVRQLNIAFAALLTLGYVVYQYRNVLFKLHDIDDHPRRRVSRSRSRSRSSRSRSRLKQNAHDYKVADGKHSRRGRKPSRRCPDCSLCNYEN